MSADWTILSNYSLLQGGYSQNQHLWEKRRKQHWVEWWVGLRCCHEDSAHTMKCSKAVIVLQHGLDLREQSWAVRLPHQPVIGCRLPWKWAHHLSKMTLFSQREFPERDDSWELLAFNHPSNWGNKSFSPKARIWAVSHSSHDSKCDNFKCIKCNI